MIVNLLRFSFRVEDLDALQRYLHDPVHLAGDHEICRGRPCSPRCGSPTTASGRRREDRRTARVKYPGWGSLPNA
ncbi:hypothetical protein [Amycolatopsis sp. cmx-8-4]|uniref:hypothetical protein n=1 Tax=Amycolatopsis sp. cmx-8-4 TaxID=2790947 RepID=UPI003979E1BA